MLEIENNELGRLAKFVVVIAIVLVVAGVLQYGVAFATIHRILYQLAERPGGPMAFRFILQPAMAAIAAIHDGRKDARIGRAPYLRTMLREPRQRVSHLREGLNATARIILLGLVMDGIYQIIVFQRFYPAEAVVIALVLAFLPYVVLRGVVLRITRRWRGSASPNQV